MRPTMCKPMWIPLNHSFLRVFFVFGGRVKIMHGLGYVTFKKPYRMGDLLWENHRPKWWCTSDMTGYHRIGYGPGEKIGEPCAIGMVIHLIIKIQMRGFRYHVRWIPWQRLMCEDGYHVSGWIPCVMDTSYLVIRKISDTMLDPWPCPLQINLRWCWKHHCACVTMGGGTLPTTVAMIFLESSTIPESSRIGTDWKHPIMMMFSDSWWIMINMIQYKTNPIPRSYISQPLNETMV